MCINSWQTHKQNEAAKPGRDLVAMNKAAVQARCTTAKETIQFQKANIMTKKIKRTKRKTGGNMDKNQMFGKPTVADEPFNKLIENTYKTDFECSQKDKLHSYEHGKRMERAVVKPTKASKGHATKKNISAAEVRNQKINSFTMKQFQNIPAKLKTRREV